MASGEILLRLDLHERDDALFRDVCGGVFQIYHPNELPSKFDASYGCGSFQQLSKTYLCKWVDGKTYRVHRVAIDLLRRVNRIGLKCLKLGDYAKATWSPGFLKAEREVLDVVKGSEPAIWHANQAVAEYLAIKRKSSEDEFEELWKLFSKL